MWLKYKSFFLSIFVVSTLNAAEVNYSASVEYTQFDNINLISVPEGDEFGQIVRGQISVIENTSNIDAQLNAGLSRSIYKNNLSRDQTLANLSANILWSIRPGFYQWFISENFTQTTIDILAADTPSNRQDTNILVLGPNFIFNLNNNSNMIIEARIASETFEENADNDRLNIAMRYNYLSTHYLTYAFNIEFEKTHFEEQLPFSVADNTKQDYFVSMNYGRGMNNVQADFGLVNIDNENVSNQNLNRYLVSFMSGRSASTNMSLEYSKNVTDTGNIISNSTGEEAEFNTLLTGVSDIFVLESLALTYTIDNDFNQFSIDLFKNKSEYLISENLDNEINGMRLNSTWLLPRRNSISIDLTYFDTTFLNQAEVREDSNSVYSLRYNYRARRNVNMFTRVESLERDSTIDLFSYDDNRITIGIEYLSR